MNFLSLRDGITPPLNVAVDATIKKSKDLDEKSALKEILVNLSFLLLYHVGQ